LISDLLAWVKRVPEPGAEDKAARGLYYSGELVAGGGLNDVTKRDVIWGHVDKSVMEAAAVIPGVWAKGLLFRPDTITNVFVNNGFTMYDYAAMGVKQ